MRSLMCVLWGERGALRVLACVYVREGSVRRLVMKDLPSTTCGTVAEDPPRPALLCSQLTGGLACCSHPRVTVTRGVAGGCSVYMHVVECMHS